MVLLLSQSFGALNCGGVDNKKLTSEEDDAYLVDGMIPIYKKVRVLKGKLISSRR